MKFTILLLAAITFFTLNSHAQTTGSFSDSVSFNSTNRGISCYVPPTYNAANSYQLIVCLHGLGDNDYSYRNYLINMLNWNVTFPNTIIICPDGGDDYESDFLAPAGDEEIIQTSIDYAKQKYNIDAGKIILQGFSLGGRSALKYGLGNPTKFKGVLLNTPAIQGLDDALNKIPNFNANFNYANPVKVPIYITCGEDDIYYYTIDKVYDNLKKNSAIVKYTTLPVLGHAIPAGKYIKPCINFFNNPGTASYDLDVFEIALASRSCNTAINPKVYVRNLGSTTVTTFDINYKLNAINNTYKWTGSIAPYELALVSLPQLIANAGSQTIEVGIGKINNIYNDSIPNNDTLSKSFQIVTNGASYPLNEGFEIDNGSWIVEESGSIYSWGIDPQIAHSGSNSMVGYSSDQAVFYTNGDVESFLSPVMDLTSTTNPHISYSYAYNYIKYTSSTWADTLEVSISTDCGATYNTLLKKGGKDLATAASPILNPATESACIFVPNANEWNTEYIDLNYYKNEKNAIIKFSRISNMGGAMYIDDVSFSKSASIQKTEDLVNVNIYPNPATDNIAIQYSEGGNTKMNIYNIVGECVMQSNLNNGTNNIDVSSLAKGVYIIQVIGKNFTTQNKLTKE